MWDNEGREGRWRKRRSAGEHWRGEQTRERERESMAIDAKQERKKKSTHKRLKAQARGKSHQECRSKQEITSERGQVCQRMQLHEREAKQIHKNRQASE